MICKLAVDEVPLWTTKFLMQGILWKDRNPYCLQFLQFTRNTRKSAKPKQTGELTVRELHELHSTMDSILKTT